MTITGRDVRIEMTRDHEGWYTVTIGDFVYIAYRLGREQWCVVRRYAGDIGGSQKLDVTRTLKAATETIANYINLS